MADLERYFALVRKHPEMFANPEGAEITVLLDEQEIREVEGLAHQYYLAGGFPTTWGDVGVVYQDNYLLVLRDAVRFADGRRWTYFRLVDDDIAQGVISTRILANYCWFRLRNSRVCCVTARLMMSSRL